jgi:endonuclease/exonuclease/phosphatase family metal-dependent hydrolase
MRIVSWNCNTSPQITRPASAVAAFTTKYNILSQRIPLSDIVVLQEVARPQFTPMPHHIWHGPMISRGIGVVVAEQYRIESHYDEAISRSVVPVTMRGPLSLTVLAVWSVPLQTSARNYVREVYNGILGYRHLLATGPVVVLGDFNSNALWDRSAGAINQTTLVQLLDNEFGLVSAYHTHHTVAPGQERDPTYYHYRQYTRPFHIDYCFIPKAWTITDVRIGTFDEWHADSDHCPLIVDCMP